MIVFLFLGSVSVYLGYDVDTLRSRSWYSLLHPRDLSHASVQHCALCEFYVLILQPLYDFESLVVVPKEKRSSMIKVFPYSFLVREGGERQVEMVVQVETADHSWVWLYMVLQLQSGEHPITCQNYVIRYYPL